MKPYKTPHKANKKIKVKERDDGMLVKSNGSNKRNPIISLPAILSSPIYQRYCRFYNNNTAANDDLSIADCLSQFMIASSSTNLYCYILAVRIKKIRILSPVRTQGTAVTLSMTPTARDSANNSFTAVPESHLDTSTTLDVPAYLSLEPSIDTPLGSWHLSTTTDSDLIRIVAPLGSTMDILFEYILNVTSSSAASFTRTVAGATPGVMYGCFVLAGMAPIGANYI